jgi:hypothetical protein
VLGGLVLGGLVLGWLVLGWLVPSRLMLGGADRLAWGGRGAGQVRDRGRRPGKDRDRTESADDGGEAAATAEPVAPCHDQGHVDRVAGVTRRLERLAQDLCV